MKHLPVAGKFITVLFTAAFLVACSGSDTKKEDEAAAAGTALVAVQQLLAQERAKAVARPARRLLPLVPLRRGQWREASAVRPGPAP